MATETKRIRAVFETDTSKYNSSMQGINKQMKMYQSEVKLASTDTKNFGQSAENLSKAQQGLSKQLELNNAKLKLYEDAMSKTNTKVEDGVKKRKELEQQLSSNKQKYDEIVKAEGKNSDQAKSLKEEIDKLSKEYEKNEKSIDSNIKKTADYQTNVNKTKGDINNLEGQLGKTNKALADHSSKWNEASKKLEVFSEKSKKMGENLDRVGNATLSVFTPMAVGIGAATKSFMDFETQMAKVNTIADYSKVSFEDIKNGVIDLSKQTGIATSDLNEALYQAMSAGVDTADSIAFMGEAVKLSKGGFTSTTQAVNILTTVLNAYGLEASETQKISDILVQTQNKGKTSVDELASSLGKVIPTAKAANVNFEQLGAAVALMTAKGIATSESVTYLNSAIGELSKSGTSASKALKNATGKTFDELMKSGESLGDVMVSLDEYAKKSGLSLIDMFGSAEAGKAALTIATDSGKEYNELLKDMGESAGSTQQAYETMMGTKSETLAVALNKTKLSFMKLGEAAIPIVDEIAGLISRLADFIEGLSDEQLKSIVNFTKWGLIMGGTAKVAGGAMSAVGSLTGGLAKMAGKTAASATATAGLNGAMTTAAGGTSFLTMAMKAGGLLLNPWALGIAGVTVAGVALGKQLAKDVVPEVDLFTDSVVRSADGVYQGTTKISEGTKEAVGAYMEMSDKAQEQLLNLQMGGTVITSEIATDLTTQFSAMGKTITAELDKDCSDQIGVLQTFFTNGSTLTAEQQANMLGVVQGRYAAEKTSTAESLARINEIVTTAANANKKIKKEEYEEIARLNDSMKTTAITSLSETEKESVAILGRIKDANGRLTAETAGDHVRALEEARIKVVDGANIEHAERVRIAEAMRADGTEASNKLADELIADAERQRKEVIINANKQKEEGITVLEEAYSGLRKEIDTDTGEILSWWEKMTKKFSGMGGKTTYEVETKYTQIGNPGTGNTASGQKPPMYNSRSMPAITKVGMPRVDYSAFNNNNPLIKTQKDSFDYARVEDIIDKFGDKLTSMDRTIKVLIDTKKISREGAEVTDREIARINSIESFGFVGR